MSRRTEAFSDSVSLRRLTLAGLAVFAITVAGAPLLAENAAESLQNIFSSVAEKVIPSVVNITSESKVKNQPGMFTWPFDEEFPFPFPFREKPEAPGGPRKAYSLGTGTVIRADGYIVTNNHVVKDGTSLKVIFKAEADQPDEVKATVVGSDPEADIAVLKVNRTGLQPVELGDSDAIKVGAWVIAIGSPYQFTHSVTVGVVSAKGRHLLDQSNRSTLQDYIQTDASINRGNSGGPLVDIHGKVIGISTAIFTPTGGNIGIGFAVPINTVKEILPQLIEGVKIQRGWLGIEYQPISKEMAKAYGITTGYFVSYVVPDTPAEKGGIKAGDVIVEFDGRKLSSSEEFRRMVASLQPGKTVAVKVLRDEEDKINPLTLNIKLGERPTEGVGAGPAEGQSGLGLKVEDMTPAKAKMWGFEKEIRGALITDVETGSPADDGDVIPGLVVTAVKVAGKEGGWKTVTSAREFVEAIKGVKTGDTVFLRTQDKTGHLRPFTLTVTEAKKEKEGEK